MAPEALDELEAKLDPSARVVVALLREENAEQKRRLEASSAQIAALTSQLGLLTEQIARQTEQLEDLRRRLFGNRTEKLPTVKEELRRRVDPDELTVDGTPMPTDPEARAKEKRRKSRKAGEAQRKDKRGLRKGLPVVLQDKSVTAEQLPEGYTLEDFRKLGDGKIVTHVEHVREHLVIQRFALETLISQDGEHIITAEGPPSVIDGGHYGPGLHAHVVVSRCDDIMPLYGNEKALERAGFPIARSTLCTMFHRTAEQLRPIYDEIRRVVRAGRYVHADETTQRVLNKEHCLKGWMWVMLSQQAIAYHYSDHRNSDTARELLGDTTGTLTIDGYSAYTCLGEKDAKRERSGCWGHGRRKFLEAIPEGIKEHENHEVLRMIADLYKIESEAEACDTLGTPEHLELRQSKSSRIVKAIWKWVDARAGKHSPKSKMAKALTYATRQRAHLERFLYDPKIRLDNNPAERALRIVALGRKRSLFAGSSEHAQNLALLHSIVATCRLHRVNPYEYIRDKLIRIQTHPASRIDELMPWRWRPPNE
jgi:transposase